jgi:phosphatidate cytidylyltransferase
MNAPLASSELFWLILVAFGPLAIGTGIRLIALRGRTDQKAADRRNSLKTWWGVTVLVVSIAILGRHAAIVAFAAISLLSFLEFTRMQQAAGENHDLPGATRPADTLAAAVANPQSWLVAIGSLLVLLHYLGLWLEREVWSAALLPVAGLISGSIVLVIGGQAKGYVSMLGHTWLGLMVTTYLLSHVVLLIGDAGPDTTRLQASAWFLYVVAMTETDDIAQALIGRRLGKRALTPVISPHKTWEGFLGGVVVSMVLSMVLGHFLLGVSWHEGLAYGMIIAVAALFGDLNMSAVKRDVGVKDSGHWLPGHGGLLDRVDSLTFTAPVVYYMMVRS